MEEQDPEWPVLVQNEKSVERKLDEQEDSKNVSKKEDLHWNQNEK